MARFYISARNGRGNTQSIGGRASVESSHTRGWNSGVEVDCIALADGTDRFDIYMTPGSGGTGHRVLVGQVYQQKPSGRPFWRPAKGRKNTQPS